MSQEISEAVCTEAHKFDSAYAFPRKCSSPPRREDPMRSSVVVPFPTPSAAAPSGQEPANEPPRSAASLPPSDDRLRAAILLGSQMAESEAQRMLAMKAQQALSTTPPRRRSATGPDTLRVLARDVTR